MMHTLSCVQCGGKAFSWTGHVHQGHRTVLAGFCKACRDQPPPLSGKGRFWVHRRQWKSRLDAALVRKVLQGGDHDAPF